MLKLGVLPFLFLVSATAHAKLSIMTTTTDLAALASEIGGEEANVEAIAKGTQDPHFIEAKPSFMVKVNKADLVLSVGLDLEVGWLPSVLRGARNPKVMNGSPGFLEVGPLVSPLEVATGKVSRAEGDVHPFGNPHITLDPVRMGQIALKVAERMGQLDPPQAQKYLERAQNLDKRFQEKTKAWKARIDKSGVKKVVTYHKTLTYFCDRFGIENVAILEPKPGIPPTSGHLLEVIGQIKAKNVSLILVENFFDASITKKILSEVSTVRAHTVPVAVRGEPHIKSLDDLYEDLVSTVEGTHK